MTINYCGYKFQTKSLYSTLHLKYLYSIIAHIVTDSTEKKTIKTKGCDFTTDEFCTAKVGLLGIDNFLIFKAIFNLDDADNKQANDFLRELVCQAEGLAAAIATHHAQQESCYANVVFGTDQTDYVGHFHVRRMYYEMITKTPCRITVKKWNPMKFVGSAISI